MKYPDYPTATHRPMIKAIFALYDPQAVLEIGIGEFSTPLFQHLEYMGVEGDPDWVNTIMAKIKTAFIIHHPMGAFHKGYALRDLRSTQIADIISFYKELPKLRKSPKLLFVDGYACTRIPALHTLGDQFDFIIYHDCQPKSVHHYNYDSLNLSGFVNYYLTSPTSWTGLLVRDTEDKGKAALEKVIEPYIKEFQKEFPECTEMKIKC